MSDFEATKNDYFERVEATDIERLENSDKIKGLELIDMSLFYVHIEIYRRIYQRLSV